MEHIFALMNSYKSNYSINIIYRLLYFITGHNDIHTDYVNNIIERFGSDDYLLLFKKLMVFINHIEHDKTKNDSSSDRNLINKLIQDNIL